MRHIISLGKMTPKSGLPIHHTKNLLLGKSKVNASQRMTTEATRSSCMGQKRCRHTCRQQRQNSLAFSQTTVFRSQHQSTIFKSPVISSTSNGSMSSTASAQFFVFSRQESGRSPQAQTSRSSVQRGKQSRVFFNLA